MTGHYIISAASGKKIIQCISQNSGSPATMVYYKAVNLGKGNCLKLSEGLLMSFPSNFGIVIDGET